MTDNVISVSITHRGGLPISDTLPPELWATVCLCSVEQARQVCDAVPADYPARGNLLEVLFAMFDFGVCVDTVVQVANEMVSRARRQHMVLLENAQGVKQHE